MATFLRVIDRDGRGRVRHGAGHLNIPDPAAGYRWPERVESVESAWQDFRLTVDPLAIDRRRDRRMVPARIRQSASQALRRPRTLVQSRGPCCSLYRLDGSLDIRRLINLVSDVHRQQGASPTSLARLAQTSTLHDVCKALPDRLLSCLLMG